MPYCKNCGNSLFSNTAFCVECGIWAGKGDLFCPNCGVKVHKGIAVCKNCNAVANSLGYGGRSYFKNNNNIGYTEAPSLNSRRKLFCIVSLFLGILAGISLWAFIKTFVFTVSYFGAVCAFMAIILGVFGCNKSKVVRSIIGTFLVGILLISSITIILWLTRI